MLLLTCPVCGLEADESAFEPGGEAHLERPSSGSADAGSGATGTYLYTRENPKGISFELWHCRHGCGKWFHAARDTQTQDFRAFYKIDDPKPVISAQRNRRK